MESICFAKEHENGQRGKGWKGQQELRSHGQLRDLFKSDGPLKQTILIAVSLFDLSHPLLDAANP